MEGCAYANPVVPVRMPGFTPTRRRIRFGGIVSRRRDSEAVGVWVGRGLRFRRVGVDVGDGVIEAERERERVTRIWVAVEAIVAVVVAAVVECAVVLVRLGLGVTLRGLTSSSATLSSRPLADRPRFKGLGGDRIAGVFACAVVVPVVCRN